MGAIKNTLGTENKIFAAALIDYANYHGLIKDGESIVKYRLEAIGIKEKLHAQHPDAGGLAADYNELSAIYRDVLNDVPSSEKYALKGKELVG